MKQEEKELKGVKPEVAGNEPDLLRRVKRGVRLGLVKLRPALGTDPLRRLFVNKNLNNTGALYTFVHTRTRAHAHSRAKFVRSYEYSPSLLP